MSDVLTRASRAATEPLLVAEVTRAASGLVQFLVLAGVLGAADYGRLAVLNALLALATPVLAVNAGTLLVRLVADGAVDVRAEVRRCATATSAGALAVFAVLWVLPWSPLPLSAVVPLVLADLVLGSTSAACLSVCQGLRLYARVRSLVVLQCALRVGACLALLVLPRSLTTWGLCLLTAMAVHALVSVRSLPDVPSSGTARPRETGSFVANALAQRVSDDLDKVLLGAFAGAAAVGRYAAAYRIAVYALVPMRAGLARNQTDLLHGAPAVPTVLAAQRSIAARAALVVPALLAASLALPMVDDGFGQSPVLALVLVPALAVRAVHFAWGDGVLAMSSAATRLATQLWSMVLPVTCLLVLVPVAGVWGAAVGTAVAEVSTVVFMRSRVRRLA